jgi:hypothetical protein
MWQNFHRNPKYFKFISKLSLYSMRSWLLRHEMSLNWNCFRLQKPFKKKLTLFQGLPKINVSNCFFFVNLCNFFFKCVIKIINKKYSATVLFLLIGCNNNEFTFYFDHFMGSDAKKSLLPTRPSLISFKIGIMRVLSKKKFVTLRDNVTKNKKL